MHTSPETHTHRYTHLNREREKEREREREREREKDESSPTAATAVARTQSAAFNFGCIHFFFFCGPPLAPPFGAGLLPAAAGGLSSGGVYDLNLDKSAPSSIRKVVCPMPQEIWEQTRPVSVSTTFGCAEDFLPAPKPSSPYLALPHMMTWGFDSHL